MVDPDVLTKLMETVLLKTAEAALKSVGARLSARTSATDLTKALGRHFDLIDRWSNTVKFKDMNQPRALFDTFVELNLSAFPKRESVDTLHIDQISLLQLSTRDEHIVLLGDVGAGKTTSLKRLVLYNLDLYRQDPALSPIPLLVELRDLRASQTICERVLAELDVQLAWSSTGSHSAEDVEARQALARTTAVEILSRMRFRVFLDGLDEMPAASRALMLHDLRELMARMSGSSLFITCRSGDYEVDLDQTKVFELRPLTEGQIDEFAKKWLQDRRRADTFLRKLKDSPYADTAVRPLALAHLCVLFERNGDIPDKPKTAYRKIVQLLLEDWDKQHSVSRPSAYASFGPDRKQEFLERLAFEIRDVRFSHRELRDAYSRICDDFSLPRREAEKVAKEIESHTGLLVKTNSETYEFAHRSLHEYLCAEYIVGYPDFANAIGGFETFPSEYAIAVALSRAPSRLMATVLFRCCLAGVDLASLDTFVRRIRAERPDFGADSVLGCALLLLDHSLEEGIPETMLADLTVHKGVVRSLRDARDLFEGSTPVDDRITLRYLGAVESQLHVSIPSELRVSATLVSAWSD
jgi:predicted NACHT family NTPase